ncbi:hypothetical protein [Hoeflea prorocentri]|uniref:Uncharacterized protein n=1 Tax=Hoeflea prorocentri TaxID=1922333 RepID=A0A9X3ZG35_9HYPH|nr:hypothetical protein [Hoeflea prorocentri]MCY6379349.1 hypothetical protein [Hoeflea prorocentri]MDA5397150.1 hypothetical protein [Hoeflea prorocentri]
MTDKITFSDFPTDPTGTELESLIVEFCELFKPLERQNMIVLIDELTGAPFVECHALASIICAHGTTDVALDPDASGDYRANRELVTNHSAFEQMKSDALGRRKFSNIVCEFLSDNDGTLEVIGGQHRFEAISEALNDKIDVHHGIKVYFDLDKDQRLDVQVISNTNIAVSADLLDRMYATMEGPELRDWCQQCGLLEKDGDFADKASRASPTTVKEARTFIVNFYAGQNIDDKKFDSVDTTPKIVKSGEREPQDWVQAKKDHPKMWQDKNLLEAGKQFVKLQEAQKAAFMDKKTKKLKGRADQIYKTRNIALLAGWAFVAGVLQRNKARLKRHYDLVKSTSKDPLRADLLAQGKHATDPEAYRGLGFRSDPKERGRFTELFWLQAEKGTGFSKGVIDTAIKGYEAKKAVLEFEKGKAKL